MQKMNEFNILSPMHILPSQPKPIEYSFDFGEKVSGWNYHENYNVGDHSPGFVHIPAKNGSPKIRHLIVPGLKSEVATYDTKRIQVLQRMGHEIYIVPLLDPGHKIGYSKDMKDFLRGVISTPPFGSEADLATFVTVHSRMGRAFIENLIDKETGDDFARDFNQKYAGCINVSGHFKTPFKNSPTLTKIYSAFANSDRYGDTTYGESTVDKAFGAVQWLGHKFRTAASKIFSDTKAMGTDSPPTSDLKTHRQNLYSSNEAEKFMLQFNAHKLSDAVKEIQILFLAGEHDVASDPETIKDVSQKFDNSRYCVVDAYHQPFLHSPIAAKSVKSFIDINLSLWQSITKEEDFTRHEGTVKSDQQYTYSNEDPMINPF